MPHPCRLRPYRKAAALSQRDLGLLLGLSSQSSVSEYEAATTRPSLATLIASEILFGVSAQDLFPGLYEEIRLDLVTRAKDLPRLKSERPLAAMTALLDRLIPNQISS
jgi:transcriptional regulator with XRE-family HTH domain